MKVSLSSDHVHYQVENLDGNKIETWSVNGHILHSVDDKPALIINDGEELKWFSNGLLHRDENLGPAYIRVPQKEYDYFYLGQIHRKNGPALIRYNLKQWYHHNSLHRIDGPAIEWEDGFKEWYLNGKCYKFNEWLRRASLDEEQKLMLKLIYG